MPRFRTIDDLDVKAKRVLVRLDLNLPVKDGKVTDATRIERSAGTIQDLAARGARVVLLSHFGRPKDGPDPSQSLRPVIPAIEAATGLKVAFAADCIGPEAESAVAALAPGRVLLLENTRFHKGEEKNDPAFVKALAKLGDVYVNDAFSAAHRAHASTEGLAHLLPSAAGRAMEAELKALSKALEHPERPVVAVIGGAKVSTKLDLIGNLLGKVDALVIGGAMANTFLAAEGLNVGKSLYEKDLLPTAREILAAAKKKGVALILPRDVVIAAALKPMAAAKTVPAGKVPSDQMILDVGAGALADLSARFETAKTVVWNGPLGAFETPPFDQGTNTAARQVGMLTKMGALVSVAGGGDTVAALANAGAEDDFTYVSTAGGAFLEWLEGKELPGVKALMIGG
jgi:phosphoglycerate kinase